MAFAELGIELGFKESDDKDYSLNSINYEVKLWKAQNEGK